MNKTQKLMNKYNEAAAKLDDAKDALELHLRKILLAMGENVGKYDALERSHVMSDGAVSCTFGYSRRGCYDQDIYTIPASIMNATDPVEAATSALEQKNAKQAEVTRQQKLAQLEQLKKELQQ